MFPLFAQATQEGFNASNTIDSLARTPLSVVLYWTLGFTIIRFLTHGGLLRLPAHRRLDVFGRVLKFIDETMDALVYTGIFVFMVLRPFVFQTFVVPSGSMVSTLLVGDYIVANKAIYRYSDPKAGDIVVFRPPVEATTPDQLDKDGEVKVDFVKRCIGVPGDLIEIKNGVLYRNGKAWEEPYRHLTIPNPLGQFDTFRERTPDEVAQLEHEDFKLVKVHGEYWPLKICGTDVNENRRSSDGTYELMSAADKFAVNDPGTEARLAALPAERVPPGYFLMMGDNRLYSFDGRGWGLVPRENIVGRSEFIWLPVAHWSRTESNMGSPATN